jgi:hypothetical protein
MNMVFVGAGLGMLPQIGAGLAAVGTAVASVLTAPVTIAVVATVTVVGTGAYIYNSNSKKR